MNHNLNRSPNPNQSQSRNPSRNLSLSLSRNLSRNLSLSLSQSLSLSVSLILRNALMTATGGQIPAHESISEAAIRILRNALMSTKIVYEQMGQNHCAHESIDEDHFESRVASRTWGRNLCRTLPALWRQIAGTRRGSLWTHCVDSFDTNIRTL